MIPLAATNQSTQPLISGIANATSGSATIQPGSFITITGQNLASTAVATTVPPPTVLGGSCVTLGNVRYHCSPLHPAKSRRKCRTH